MLYAKCNTFIGDKNYKIRILKLNKILRTRVINSWSAWYLKLLVSLHEDD